MRRGVFAALLVIVVAAASWRPAAANVTLLYFRATARPADVALVWETATELNTAGYYVRRGTTQGGPFERVGAYVPAQGDSLVGARYTATDKPPASGLYFYQLEEIESSQRTLFYGPTSVLFGAASPTASTQPTAASSVPTTAVVPTATPLSPAAPTAAAVAATPTATGLPKQGRSTTSSPPTAAPANTKGGSPPILPVFPSPVIYATSAIAGLQPVGATGEGRANNSAASTPAGSSAPAVAPNTVSGLSGGVPGGRSVATWTPGTAGIAKQLAQAGGPHTGIAAPPSQRETPSRAPLAPALSARSLAVLVGLFLAAAFFGGRWWVGRR